MKVLVKHKELSEQWKNDKSAVARCLKGHEKYYNGYDMGWNELAKRQKENRKPRGENQLHGLRRKTFSIQIDTAIG